MIVVMLLELMDYMVENEGMFQFSKITNFILLDLLIMINMVENVVIFEFSLINNFIPFDQLIVMVIFISLLVQA